MEIILGFPHFDPCVLLSERADLFLRLFPGKKVLKCCTMERDSSSARLWHSFLLDRGEKAGGAVIPLNDIWVFVTAHCQASAPTLVGRVNQQGHGGSDWTMDRSGWRTSMPELMGNSFVSHGRCHDNAAAKLAKRAFIELDIYIPTDGRGWR